MDVINNRNSSPYAKEYAQNEFNRLEKRRTEINTLREADYRDQRELWQKKKEAFDNPSYDIEHLNKRLAAEKTQRDLVVLGPLEEKHQAAEGKAQASRGGRNTGRNCQAEGRAGQGACRLQHCRAAR